MISYAKKTAAYAAVIRANPNISANEIGRRYKGTKLGMRKQDRNDFVKNFKEQLKQEAQYKDYMKNSDMSDSTRKRLSKEAEKQAYKYAKNTTRKGERLNEKKIIYKPVSSLENKTFARIPPQNRGDFTEFYG